MSTNQSKYLQISLATLVACVYASAMAISKPAEKAPNDTAFHKGLLEVAGQYKSYGRVDDYTRWASALCAPPPASHARISKSTGDHGRKVYFLYAKDRDQYFAGRPPQPGQAVVKESWYGLTEGSLAPVASSKQGDLFIMLKLDGKTPNTDNGWVYGTVSPDLKTVTSAGRVQSCVECHASATNDRLFGMTK